MPGMLGIEFQVWHALHADFCCESLSTDLVFLAQHTGPGADFSPVFVHGKSLVLRFPSEDVCGRLIEIK